MTTDTIAAMSHSMGFNTHHAGARTNTSGGPFPSSIKASFLNNNVRTKLAPQLADANFFKSQSPVTKRGAILAGTRD